MPSVVEPEYLNLAHQFLDTNFIESSSKRNSFSLLPILTTNPEVGSLVSTTPPQAVDYFSYELTSTQYHSCWKNIANNQFMKQCELSNIDNISKLKKVQPMDDLMTFLPTTSRARLENACWRAWGKNMNKLKELDPAKINWFKENDVTVLYGPLIVEENIYCTEKLNRVYDDDSEGEEFEEEEEEDELFTRRDSLSSSSSVSTQGSEGKPLKSILKQNNIIKNSNWKRCNHEKRISFSDTLLTLG